MARDEETKAARQAVVEQSGTPTAGLGAMVRPGVALFAADQPPSAAEDNGGHYGRLERFGKYSWRCLECGATGSHPLSALPLIHNIGENTALEP